MNEDLPLSQLHPVTRIYDAESYLIAVRRPGGPDIPNTHTSVGQACVAWDSESQAQATLYEDGQTKPVSEWSRKRVIGVVVWDGACHAQLTGWYESKAPGAPRGGTPNMYQRGASGAAQWQTQEPAGGSSGVA